MSPLVVVALASQIREYRRRHSTARVVDVTEEYEDLLKEDPHVKFSGEEAFGRYLDMHELYNEYINSKFEEPMDSFSQTELIPCNLKFTR
ncbi:hypothetical protein BHE74_00057799 [Ensete ventricosum]|uniref:Uncharacterized protein n=1 Tax=Ensete ventricosum TaxID=4639 RepID=A0A444FPZ6_ENSVE|nr:hypothetical protein GW17_00011006 [Ensete ventricosum]RWW37129.1 hypothetical protein BHE74_00057799 [Ensete ventricosum]RZR74159.1 hypothetical protein BHM03_00032938 [Ensete ventricosum]